MRYHRLGRSGLIVSQVGLGCNNLGRSLDPARSRDVIEAAVDAGITFFDTADIYGGLGGSETALGAALGKRRDQVVIATKFGLDDTDMGYGTAAGALGGRAYIRRAVEASLRRLNTDYIDLYQLHTPDPATPIAETLSALSDLVREGKVRYIGHSNFSGWQLAEAAHTAREIGAIPFVSAQNRWSLLDRAAETDLVPAALHYGVGVLPYSPLANGLLSGRVTDAADIAPTSRLAGNPAYVTREKLDRVRRLREWGAVRGRTLLEVAIGSLAAHPACGSVIAGATSAEQVRANATAADSLPSPEEAAEIRSLSQNES